MPLDDTPDTRDTPDRALPCAVGLLAATLALMTAYAAPEPTARVDAPTQRRLMARKILSNLFFLQGHPHAPPALRQVATTLHGRWQALAQACGAAAATQAQGLPCPANSTTWH